MYVLYFSHDNKFVIYSNLFQNHWAHKQAIRLATSLYLTAVDTVLPLKSTRGGLVIIVVRTV